MSDLMSSQSLVDKSLKGLGDTGNQVSAKLQSAYAKVGEATKRVELAQTQAALAMQKAQTAAHDDSSISWPGTWQRLKPKLLKNQRWPGFPCVKALAVA